MVGREGKGIWRDWRGFWDREGEGGGWVTVIIQVGKRGWCNGAGRGGEQ